MMASDRFTDLAGLYALDALDGDELVEFERHLESPCPSCRREVDELKTVVTRIPLGLPAAPPPRNLRRRILDAAAAEPNVQRAPDERIVRLPAWTWGSLAAAAVLVLALGIAVLVVLRQLADVRHERDQLAQQGGAPSTIVTGDSSAYWRGRYENQLRTTEAQADTLARHYQDALRHAGGDAALRTQVADLSAKLGKVRALTRLLGDPTTQIGLFAPADSTKSSFAQAAVRVVWNPAKRSAFLLGSDLPTTVGQRVYEMWAIGPDHVPVPAGWFRVGDDGIGLNATGEMAQIPTAQLFAISEEAHGPQQKPSSVVMITK